MEVTVGGTKIKSKRSLKYLGVIIDDRLNFEEQVEFIGQKAKYCERFWESFHGNFISSQNFFLDVY